MLNTGSTFHHLMILLMSFEFWLMSCEGVDARRFARQLDIPAYQEYYDQNSSPYKVRTPPLYNSPPPENILLLDEKGGHKHQAHGSKVRENHQPVLLKSHRDDELRNSINNNNGNTQTFGVPEIITIGKLPVQPGRITQHDSSIKYGREEYQSTLGNTIPSHDKAKSGIVSAIVPNKPLVTAELNKNHRGLVAEKLLERASPSLKIKKPTIRLSLNATASRKEDDIKVQGRFYDGLSDDLGLISLFSYFRNPALTRDLDEYFSTNAGNIIDKEFKKNMFDHSGFPGHQVDSRSSGTNEEHLLENRRRQVNGQKVKNSSTIKSVSTSNQNHHKIA